MDKIKKYFYTGLFALLPIVLTLFIFNWAFNFVLKLTNKTKINKFIGNILEFFLDKTNIEMDLTFISYVVSIIILFLFICLAGMTLRVVFFAKILKQINNIFLKMPIFKQVYKTISQITNVVSRDSSKTYQRVVLLEYPRKGIYSMGFVTSEQNHHAEEVTGVDHLCNVFIPTAPNPTSGVFLMVPFNELTAMDIPVETAIKLIISAGLVTFDEEDENI